MDTIIKQLTSSSYWTLNKDLCRKIGLQNTLVLQHFIDLQYKVFGGKEFYQQQDRIQDELGISERQVKQTISFLLNEGFISVEKKGIPAKNYYLISEDKITSVVRSLQTNQSGQIELTGKDELNSQRKELNKKEKENNNKNNSDGGWEKVIGLFPPTKHNGIVEAAIVWNNLEQKEKQSVMRHLNPYVKNTEPKFMKQIGNYFNERMWENMKSKPSTKIKMLDYNFIEWFKDEYRIERFDEARTDLAALQIHEPQSFQDLENEYKQLKISNND